MSFKKGKETETQNWTYKAEHKEDVSHFGNGFLLFGIGESKKFFFISEELEVFF
jgi:hypothetical protein